MKAFFFSVAARLGLFLVATCIFSVFDWDRIPAVQWALHEMDWASFVYTEWAMKGKAWRVH